ncbi:MAG TPA: DEAD/DEAH box helicase, partial [Chthoniobacteraceae bacterium]|nr:DEAD/DEAH box helicase [Chthoniobacteraceae bacterium]
ACFTGGKVTRLSYSGGKVEAVCEQCREPGLCRHGLVVWMTVMRVLHGTRFHGEDLTPERLKVLTASLKVRPAQASRPRVVFSLEREGRRELDFDHGGRGASWISEGPPEGMEWLLWQKHRPGEVAARFGEWLATAGTGMELVVEREEGAWTGSGVGWRWLRAATALRLNERGVALEWNFYDGAEAVAAGGEVVDLGYGMILLPGRNEMAGLRDAEGWLAGRELIRTIGGSEASWEAWARFAPGWPLSGVVLYDREGRAVEPEAVEGEAVVQVEAGEGGRTRFRPQMRLPGGAAVAVPERFGREWAQVAAEPSWALLLRSRARRGKVLEWWGRLAALAGEERERGLQAAGDDPAFTSRAMYGEEAERCLRRIVALCGQWDAPFLTVAGGQWQVVGGWGRWVTKWAMLPGADPLAATGGEPFCAVVETREAEAALAQWLARCEAEGMRLEIDGREARTVKLALSLQVTQGGDLDWFELHPEAKAGELAIPREAWAALLETGRFEGPGGEWLLIPGGELERLRGMERLLSEGSRVERLALFEWLAMREQGVACELPPGEREVLESLWQLTAIPQAPVPAGLCRAMRDYQRRGYEWLLFLYRHRFGACLADDMGLGKTVQALALLQAVAEGIAEGARDEAGRALPHLVVVPPTLLFNWQNEIARFAPGLRVCEYAGQGRSSDFTGADLVLTTYELVRRDAQVLEKQAFDVMVLDEAQAIKNIGAARTKALARLSARFRLCLTGTPLENRISEFYSLMEAAVPGLFGTHRKFLEAYEAGEPVVERARPFLLRRTREKILAELPPKEEADLYLPLSHAQRECYTRTVGAVRKEVLAAYGDRPAQQAGMMALAALTRLRQVCIAPAMLAGELEARAPKLEYLLEALAAVTQEGNAALVFSQFVKALDLVGRALEEEGLDYLRLDGSTPVGKRKELVEAFASGASPGIFLISLKAGGAGLNLPRANYVYHLDPWWNPAVEAQATARAHRMGQTKGVYVQRLLMRHTVEEKMMVLKARKAALFEEVVEQGHAAAGGTGGGAMLTADDFRFLLEGSAATGGE